MENRVMRHAAILGLDIDRETGEDGVVYYVPEIILQGRADLTRDLFYDRSNSARHPGAQWDGLIGFTTRAEAEAFVNSEWAQDFMRRVYGCDAYRVSPDVAARRAEQRGYSVA